jgi:hypothetical protein
MKAAAGEPRDDPVHEQHNGEQTQRKGRLLAAGTHVLAQV